MVKRHVTLWAVVVLAVTAGSAKADAPDDVSAEQMAGYIQLYGLDIPNSFNFNSAGVPYSMDNSSSIAPGSFLRVGYYFELQGDSTGNVRQWVWASMDPFNSDPTMLGVPNSGTGIVENGTLVSNMNVETNHPLITPGTAITTGNIEFWASNYGQSGGGALGSYDNQFDWKDSGGTTDPVRCPPDLILARDGGR